ncbi:hypothetical protein ACFL4X_00380 [Gemmatimonadota bacterium]
MNNKKASPDINCVFCGQPEEAHNFVTGRREQVKSGPDVRAITCSRCVQRLLAADTEGLNRLYDKALAKGTPDQANAGLTFLQERGDTENVPEPETGNGRQCMAGERPLRSAKVAHQRKDRYQSNAFSMD